MKYNKITETLATFIGSANFATILVENQEFRDLLMEQHSSTKAGYASMQVVVETDWRVQLN